MWTQTYYEHNNQPIHNQSIFLQLTEPSSENDKKTKNPLRNIKFKS